MPQRNRPAYTVAFSAVVCIVCAVLVSSAAVALRDQQLANSEIDRKRNVLKAAGMMREDEVLDRADVEQRFAAFQVAAVDLRTGREDPSFQAIGYDMRRAQGDPTASRAVPANPAQITRLPNYAIAYKKIDANGQLELLVLPIEGKGLWSTMYGFLALGPDLQTVRGLTYYQHGETPGLGGEVDNPRWQALWPGRQVFDRQGQPAIEVIRGRAGPAEADPHRVDGLAGATLTSRGVSAMLQFWLGQQGFGPYLQQLKKEGANGRTS